MSRAALVFAAVGLVALLAWITLREGDSLDGPDPRPHSRRTETPGGAESEVPVSQEETREIPAGPVAPKPASIRGLVLNPGGSPCVAARVSAAPDGGDAVGGETDPDGRFRVVVPPGRTTVRITTRLYPPHVVEVVAPADLGTVRLERGYEITGRVVDEQGESVSGAAVVTEGPVEVKAVTGDDGEYRLTGVPKLPVTVRTRGPELRMVGEPPEVTPPAVGIVLEVKRLRIGSGTVRAEDDGKPIHGATVRLTLSTGGWSQILTEATGVFAFDLTDARYSDPRLRFTVLVTAPGFEDATVADLTIDEIRPAAKLTVKLMRAVVVEPGSLRGRVLYDTGAPFHGSLTLSFSREGQAGEIVSLETNEKGEFLVEKVTPGEYVLRSAPHGESLLRETGKTLRITPGGEETTEFTLIRGGDVRVQVSDADGAAAKDYEVAVLNEDGTVHRRFLIKVGTVVIPDLAPGKARIRVSKHGYRTEETEVTVIKDQATDATVRLNEAR